MINRIRFSIRALRPLMVLVALTCLLVVLPNSSGSNPPANLTEVKTAEPTPLPLTVRFALHANSERIKMR